MKRAWAGTVIALCAAFAHAGAELDEPRESAPLVLPLEGPISERNAQISGLAWRDADTLVLLPQYPRPHLYQISMADVVAAIDGRRDAPIAGAPLFLDDAGIPDGIDGYEGFEAIAFDGDRVFMAIEAGVACRMTAWLVRGDLNSELNTITLDPDRVMRLPLPHQRCNMAVESLAVLADGRVLAVMEHNGVNITERAVAYVADPNLLSLSRVPFPTIEYRVTDATNADREGRFWVINYFWPGERRLLDPGPDRIRERHGAGKTHQDREWVERLVEMEFRQGRVRMTDTPPVAIQLDDLPRNWEGLVRLNDRGFLVITDMHPETIFAFVPFPSDEDEDEETTEEIDAPEPSGPRG